MTYAAKCYHRATRREAGKLLPLAPVIDAKTDAEAVFQLRAFCEERLCATDFANLMKGETVIYVWQGSDPPS